MKLEDYNDTIFYLDMFEKPFGFFESMVKSAAKDVLTKEDIEDIEHEKQRNNNYASREK